jgi:hypothetical protein
MKKHNLTKFLSPKTSEIKLSRLNLSVNELCMSFIHKKRELATLFFSKVQVALLETEEELRVKFNIGYLQVDNQSEGTPTYAVMLKPRDMYYQDGLIKVSMEETETEKQERELLGADGFTSENAKAFQSEVVVSKKENISEVVYIESIVFLMQTLII